MFQTLAVRGLLVGLFLVAPLIVPAPTASAVPTVYRIQIDNVGGFFTFVDPPGFSCITGIPPQHVPPNSIERRCVPTFPASFCGDPAVAAALDGLPGASVQANGMCNNFLPLPPFAGCVASVPPFAVGASCSTGPIPSVTFGAFEFVCHAPASGFWIRYHVDCYATIG